MGHDQLFSQLFGKSKGFFSERETAAAAATTTITALLLRLKIIGLAGQGKR